MDINDGSRTDYTEFNEHPTLRTNGLRRNAKYRRKYGSYALLDTTAMMAMFPAVCYIK